MTRRCAFGWRGGARRNDAAVRVEMDAGEQIGCCTLKADGLAEDRADEREADGLAEGLEVDEWPAQRPAEDRA